MSSDITIAPEIAGSNYLVTTRIKTELKASYLPPRSIRPESSLRLRQHFPKKH